MPLMHIISNLGYILIAVAGGLLVSARAISLGDIQAFIQYASHFGQPIVQLAQIANVIQSTIAAAERVYEILDEAEQSADPEPGLYPEELRGRVSIEGLSFSYKDDEPLIESLSLEVSPGQSVAIVGPTGAGKTTLVNLLMRFYEAKGGAIRVDGVDSRDMGRERLRSVFGMVLQDTWLFKGSIRDNIAYGRDGASEADIQAASLAAQADHFIRTLPEGYDTVLNEEASNLSEGQRQLITIARAFLADPAILILDEATSSVDTRTEVHIQKAMRAILKGRTSFVIAHRLSTIRDADLILVMDKGRIVERGGHEELLRAGGFYHGLYASQFS
jgi:ATP-binding cassette, subfamily B, multidrug efflux pump